jgi:Zn-dependent M28 family amino/carboxypeptidase
MKFKVLLLGVGMVFFYACKTDKPVEQQNTEPVSIVAPRFDRDKAYDFVAAQVAFGPRVPNTAAHTACRDWMLERFSEFGAEVIRQSFQVRAYDGTMLNATNIIARYNPGASSRILLSAHWDSRPMADSPLSTERQAEPIPGADDGASGVGVLLEVARQLQLQPLGQLGVDIVLFDVEDYGDPSGGAANSWALGSQHWSRNLHAPAGSFRYGILLDMVGSRGARFAREQYSVQFAPAVVDKVWKLAQGLGYGNYFVNDYSNPITDDHYFVNTIARIPMIDIINQPLETKTGFGDYWHTHNDNMDIIDSRTLRAVGQVLLELLYREDQGVQ